MDIPGNFAVPPIALPRDAVLPDYGTGGLFGLVYDIGAFLDGAPWRTPAVAPPPARGTVDGRVLVFLLVDGLGDHFLQRFGQGSRLLAHRERRVTSVFLSTTASAVTTTLTGIAPVAHGLTGWFIHDRRFGGVIAPLPMTRRAGGSLGGFRLLPRLFPYRTQFQQRRRPSVLVTPADIAWSPFSRRHARGARICPYAGLDDMLDAIDASVCALERRRSGGYVHAYYPDFDSISHDFGASSAEAVAAFTLIDAAFNRLLARLDGRPVDVVVSADHGFIDAPAAQALNLADYPEAAAMLAAPLFGERRAAFCEVVPGAQADFEAFAAEALAGRAVVVRSPDLIAAGLLGPGRAHPRIRERTGTHALLMERGWTIRDELPGEDPHVMRGVHGGLSPEEMWIPVIRARCG